MALPTKDSAVSGNITRYKRSEPLNNNRNNSVTRSKVNEPQKYSSKGSTEQSIEENESSQQTKKSSSGKHIGIFVGALLSFFALFLDITELLLDAAGTLLAAVGVVFGYLKDFTTLIILPALFWALGAPFWKGRKAKKKMISMVSAFLVGLVPWLGAVMPETLISVMVTIHLINQEADEEPEIKINPNITRFKR